MSWLSETWERRSEKNGLIKVKRRFGVWEVTVDGIYETAWYTTLMWRSAVRRIPKTATVKRILLLGLAGGGSIDLLHRRFPGAHITALEWDPVMIEIMERIRLFPASHRPRIVLGDVRETLPQLTEHFDLILVDLFKGAELPSWLCDEKFLEQLSQRLTPYGYLLLNAFRTPDVLSFFDRRFACSAAWRYRLNRLALYRPFGCGRMGEAWPEGYQNYRSVPAYVRRDVQTQPNFFVVESAGPVGLHWHHGPLEFEGYFSDQEPKVSVERKKKFVNWQPLSRLDRPRGWWRPWMQMNARLTGFAEIKDPEKYWLTWSSHMQRHRERWLKQTALTIREVSCEAYLAAFAQAGQPARMKQLYTRMLPQKLRAHGELMHLFAALDATGAIVAGLAVIDVPEANLSIHFSAFYLPSAEKTSASVGLIDAWFRHGIEHRLRFLDFDLFYAPGDPRSWRGFSRFKSQFGTRFIRYPNPLVKWV